MTNKELMQNIEEYDTGMGALLDALDEMMTASVKAMRDALEMLDENDEEYEMYNGIVDCCTDIAAGIREFANMRVTTLRVFAEKLIEEDEKLDRILELLEAREQ